MENNLAPGVWSSHHQDQTVVYLHTAADLEHKGCMKHPFDDTHLEQMLPVVETEVLLAVSGGLDAQDRCLARRGLGHGT